MRLAVIGDEVGQDPRIVASAAAQAGFDGIEVRSAYGRPPQDLNEDQLAAVGAAIREAGLAVAGFAPPVFKCDMPERDALEACVALYERSMAQARAIGAPLMRIFSLYRQETPRPVEAGRVIADALATSPPTLPLVIETGTRTNTPTLTHTMQLLDALGRDDVRILWDPGNTVFSGFSDERFPADYTLARSHIAHVHVKDPSGSEGYVELGQGDLDWPLIMEYLLRDGYTGYLSLETHFRNGRTLTQFERDEPWGCGFSDGAFDASVTSMERLAAMAGMVRSR